MQLRLVSTRKMGSRANAATTTAVDSGSQVYNMRRKARKMSQLSRPTIYTIQTRYRRIGKQNS